MTLTSVSTFQVPLNLVDHTNEALRVAGKRHREAFVLWTGVLAKDGRLQVRAVHVPQQTAYSLSSGLCVRVEGDELHRLNIWLYENGQLLAVQVHTHPTEAYHSATDDTYPIVTGRGGLSIVVPNFCREGMLGSGVAAYRLDRQGWTELPRGGLLKLLEVT